MKGAPTRKVWFYKLDPGRNMGKTNPLNDDDMAVFVTLQKTKADSDNSWSIDAKAIDPVTFDLSVKNPNKTEEAALRDPKDMRRPPSPARTVSPAASPGLCPSTKPSFRSLSTLFWLNTRLRVSASSIRKSWAAC